MDLNSIKTSILLEFPFIRRCYCRRLDREATATTAKIINPTKVLRK